MGDFFLHIYDFLHGRRHLCMLALFVLSGLLLAMMSSLSYNENIFSFLPMSDNNKKALSIYQDISGGQRVVAMFRQTEAEAALYDAIEDFSQQIVADSATFHVPEVTSKIDLDYFLGITDFLYANLPVMLTDADYQRMEQLLSQPSYFDEQLSRDFQQLMSSEGSVRESFIRQDPLDLFSPVVDRLMARQASLPFQFVDGLIRTHDQQYALAMFDSPYGPLESAENARLIESVEAIASRVQQSYPGIEIGITGAPAISVGNARQIKQDSIYAISISLVLILGLLLYSFRKVKDLLLIGVSVIFGWVFAMGFIAMLRNEVSLIVLGIGSIIIGIAVNYPLHFIAHVGNGSLVRAKLKEMVAPLLIGNVTTVGAFASLIPMNAPALRDLGLFAAFMLIGTIVFVLVFLPHLVSHNPQVEDDNLAFGRLSSFNPRFSRWGLAVLAALTLFFGYNSFHASFDSDIRHINYMSDTQQQLLSDLGVSAGLNDTTSLYLVAEGETWNEALEVNAMIGMSDIQDFICSEDEQQRRIDRWEDFWKTYRGQIDTYLPQSARSADFKLDAFADFFTIIETSYHPQPLDYFEPIRTLLFPNSFSTASGAKAVIETVSTAEGLDASALSADIEKATAGRGFVFDLPTLNHSVAESLSADFNYIGWICGLIVFLFLWFSFGRIELSVLAFLPMALGWIWILGIMHLLGIQFNIVNVILATFIFGQGDDYTIFMTEGLISEYAYRKKLLSSFKNSILISALIMFIGMGSLIVARHPALSSLAEVTIVGMLSVVFMAWVIPVLSFSWLVSHHGQARPIPVTLPMLFRTTVCRLAKLVNVRLANPYDQPFITGASSQYYHHFLIGQYTYKGYSIEQETRYMLKKHNDFCSWIDDYQPSDASTNVIRILHAGRGQFSLLFAWVHPELEVYSSCSDPDDAALLASCSLCPANLHVLRDADVSLPGQNIIDLSLIAST